MGSTVRWMILGVLLAWPTGATLGALRLEVVEVHDKDHEVRSSTLGKQRSGRVKLSDLVSKIASKNTKVFAALDATTREYLAWVAIKVRRFDQGLEIDILHIESLERRRRDGIASTLLMLVLREYQSQTTRLVAQIKHKDPAQEFFRAIGFVPNTEDQFSLTHTPWYRSWRPGDQFDAFSGQDPIYSKPALYHPEVVLSRPDSEGFLVVSGVRHDDKADKVISVAAFDAQGKADPTFNGGKPRTIEIPEAYIAKPMAATLLPKNRGLLIAGIYEPLRDNRIESGFFVKAVTLQGQDLDLYSDEDKKGGFGWIPVSGNFGFDDAVGLSIATDGRSAFLAVHANWGSVPRGTPSSSIGQQTYSYRFFEGLESGPRTEPGLSNTEAQIHSMVYLAQERKLALAGEVIELDEAERTSSRRAFYAVLEVDQQGLKDLDVELVGEDLAARRDTRQWRIVGSGIITSPRTDPRTNSESLEVLRVSSGEPRPPWQSALEEWYRASSGPRDTLMLSPDGSKVIMPGLLRDDQFLVRSFDLNTRQSNSTILREVPDSFGDCRILSNYSRL